MSECSEQRHRRVNLYLEVAAASPSHLHAICSGERGRSVREVIEMQSFGGADIAFATNPYIPPLDELCEVPHFEHDAQCEGCGGPGVYRLFEVEAFGDTDGIAPGEMLGRYPVGGHIEVVVSGFGGHVDLTTIPGYADDEPAPEGRVNREYDGADQATAPSGQASLEQAVATSSSPR